MNKQEKLEILEEIRDPSLKMQKILTDRSIADAIFRMSAIKGDKPEYGVDYLTKEEMDSIIANIQSNVKDGEPGYTPQHGVDYFTQEQIDSFIAYIQSNVQDGEKGEQGKNGYTPIRGVDYWTKEDLQKIKDDIQKLIPKIKESNSIDIQKLIDKSIEDIKSTHEVIGTKLTAFEQRLIRLGGGGASYLTQLLDVISGSQTNGQVLAWDDTLKRFVFVNQTPGTPAISVTDETTYGIAKAVGVSTNYARQDHTHGSPATPTTANVADTSNKRYVTDAQLVVIGNTSGTNTGDQVISDATISTSDITTNNATTAKHGFLQKLPGGTTTFLRGDGAFATPSGTTNSYLMQSFTSQTSVTVTHNFGTYPIVQVIDSNGNVIIPKTINNSSTNAFTIILSATTSGNVIASVGSPQANSLISISADYTIVATDKFIKQTALSKIVTLPTAVGRQGQEFIIINASIGTTTLNTTSSQTINGSLTEIFYPQETRSVVSDGSNWLIY